MSKDGHLLKKETSTIIRNVGLDKTLFLGSVAATEQLQFFNNGEGYYIAEPSTGAYNVMGGSVTIAMGLTECCVEAGRGKVRSPFYQFSEASVLIMIGVLGCKAGSAQTGNWLQPRRTPFVPELLQ